jgi:hypothetical protein
MLRPHLHLERASDREGGSRTAWCADYWSGESTLRRVPPLFYSILILFLVIYLFSYYTVYSHPPCRRGKNVVGEFLLKYHRAIPIYTE